jgi:hypothetical protein
MKSWSHCRELGYPVPQALPAFETIAEALKTVLSDGWISVRVINSVADSIPRWEGEGATEPHLKSILIGGNLLSRGLTMPNLLTSYFMRKPEQADTMLQMARWLGYRRSVAYLMSVYSTQACHADMTSIAAAEQEVDATPMEGFKPSAVDEILGLTARGLRSTVLLPLGYREADKDWLVNMKKVRRTNENFITEVK